MQFKKFYAQEVKLFRLPSEKGISFHSKMFITALDLTHAPVHWLSAVPGPGIKRLGSKADCSLLFIVETENAQRRCIHGQVRNSAQGQFYCYVIVLKTWKNIHGRPGWKAIFLVDTDAFPSETSNFFQCFSDSTQRHLGAWGNVVVKTLQYQPDGLGIGPR